MSPFCCFLNYQFESAIVDDDNLIVLVMLFPKYCTVLRWLELEIVKHLKPQAFQLVCFVFEEIKVIADGLDDFVVLVGLIFVFSLDLGENGSLNALLSLHVFHVFIRNELSKIAGLLQLSLLLVQLFFEEFFVFDVRVQAVLYQFFFSGILDQFPFDSLDNFFDSSNKQINQYFRIEPLAVRVDEHVTTRASAHPLVGFWSGLGTLAVRHGCIDVVVLPEQLLDDLNIKLFILVLLF